MGEKILEKEKIISNSNLERSKHRLSKYLISYRKRNGLTQSEVAKELEFSLPYYRAFEYGSNNSRLKGVLEFLQVFADLEGITASEFLEHIFKGEELVKNDTLKLAPNEKKLVQSLRTVNPEIKNPLILTMTKKKGPDLELLIEAMTKLSEIKNRANLYSAILVLNSFKK